jgi:hypothetical protein
MRDMNDTAPASTGSPGPGDLFEIYFSPSEVYDRRRGGKFGLPLVVFAVASIILFFVTKDLLRPVMDAEWRVASQSIMEKNPQLTPDQMAGMRSMGEKFALVGVAIYSISGPLLAGLVLWIVSKFVGLKPALPVAMTIAVFALFPMLLEYIVSAAQSFIVPESSITSRFSLSLGPARFMDAASPLARAVVGHIDVFTVWTAFLMYLGLRVITRATSAQAAIASGVTWLVGLIPPVMGAMR